MTEVSIRKKASYHERCKGQQKNSVRCNLCPHNCIIREGSFGICNVRKNIGGTLYAMTYGKLCSLAIDPIEKKPLYHFFPGQNILSMATIGCNLKCSFCQNWQISRAKADKITDETGDMIAPNQVIDICKKNSCKMIAYTYTEPTVFYDYMIDIAKLAQKAKIRNVIVSNGFINEKPLRELCRYIDAANIDLKSFDDSFYKRLCKGRLNPVLRTLKILKETGVWLEITNLIIPEENDDLMMMEKMCAWIAKELGTDVPLHLSRFHPDNEMLDKDETPLFVLEKAEEIAKKHLDYVYVGNVMRANETVCPTCKKKLIERSMTGIRSNLIKAASHNKGRCPECNTIISGVW